MNYWQFKFKDENWNWEDVSVGHIEDWRYPRLKKHKDIAVEDIVFIYRLDALRGIYFIAKIIDIDFDRDNPIDIEIIYDFKDKCFRPEDNGFSLLVDKINKLSQNGSIYKFLKEDNPVKLYNILTGENIEIDTNQLAEEVDEKIAKKLKEGAVKYIAVNAYERNREARTKCLDMFGYKCSVCGMDFENIYGNIGKDFIHVHHLIEISTVKKEYIINPIKDLRPVCPNCHAMLHKKKPAYSIIELKKMITKKG